MKTSMPGSSGNDMHALERTENIEDIRGAKDDQLPVKLNLKLSESFLNFIGLVLAWHRFAGNDSVFGSNYEELKTAQSHLKWNESRRKPARLPAKTLHIGNKKFIRTDANNLFAKFCYRTKTIVCQMCKDKLCWKVDIPLEDIVSFFVRFDRNIDFLKIEAKSTLKPFRAAKPLPGMFHDWEIDDYKDDEDYFPESKSVLLEIEKGTLGKSYAKLMYTDPSLLRFTRGVIIHDREAVHAHEHQSQTLGAIFPDIGGSMQDFMQRKLANTYRHPEHFDKMMDL